MPSTNASAQIEVDAPNPATALPRRPRAKRVHRMTDAEIPFPVQMEDGTGEHLSAAVEPMLITGAGSPAVEFDNGFQTELTLHTSLPQDEGPQLSPQVRNEFIRFRQSKIQQRSARVALAMTKFLRIRLPYPRQIEGMGELEELRLVGQQMRGHQQLGVTIFERSGCGKSTLAEQYKLMTMLDAPKATVPVVHARMGATGTARDLWVSVMAELDDGFPNAGNEHSLRRRAMQKMDEAGVQMLIIDETQHAGSKSGFSKEVTAEIKIMLDTGRVPVVLLGTEAAVPIVSADRELAGRMFAPCRLAPLLMDDVEDFELWLGFLNALEAQMLEDGILSAPFELSQEDLANALGQVTEGIIGQLMRVMLTAVRNMARAGHDTLTREDLIEAVDEWSLGNRFAKSNPLRAL